MSRCTPYVLILFLISCAVSPPPGPSDTDATQARDSSLTRIRTLASAGDARELRKAGASFISHYPDDPDIEEVRLLVAQAGIGLGFYEEAGEILSPIIIRGGADPAKGQAHILMARVLKSRGRFDEAARALLSSLSTDLDDSQRETARNLLEEVVPLLPREELDAIRKTHGSSPGVELVLEAALSYARASQDTASVRSIMTELRLLHRDEPAADQPFEGSVTIAAPGETERNETARYTIGVLCPLGGRYAPLGDEFLKGASVAMREARERGTRDVELVVADTRGDPLVARSVAERLIDEEGVVALVGCVLSSSTIAAAQVAQYNGTVLVSPVATEEGIAEIGEQVFQMGSDIEIEITALARIACMELNLRRIAFLAVDDLRSRGIGELFGREVALQGGEVCIYAYFPEGSTDFHETIRNLRKAAPEALFIASDVEDLILILPQLSFYEFGVQLLGLSRWHSNQLLRMAGRDMEGVVFPGKAGEQRDEEQFLTAAVLLDEPIDDTNPFILGGYKGVRTVLAAIQESAASGSDLKGALMKALYHRRHPYVELVSGQGIPFYTVRDGRIEPYTTIRIEP
ncbi:MAG TPA: ABC transporter substrate-binding protein [Patescibacteria group bacterium]|nr:ABC transporter substrate-binding protein [Patescibacteria group bacterium]